MEFKGTRGKWRKADTSIGFVYASKMYGNIELNAFSLKINNDGKLPNLEIEANALLISKSPEMLEMLQEFIDSCCGVQECEEELIKGLGNQLYNSVLKAKQLIKDATEL